ncbi:MAG: hypothetical protein ACK2UK_07035 [Candidatus Promineifilaceae bacterium]
MSEMEARAQMGLVEDSNDNWKMKSYLIGGAIGAAVGIGTAFLLARSSQKSRGGPPEIEISDALKLSVAVIGLVRGIAALGD